MSQNHKQRQRGASAVEFAFVFPVLFLLVYGVIVYSYIYVLQQSITFAAQHSAEAAAAVDPIPATDKNQRIIARIKSTAAEQLRWLPASQRARVLGENNGQVLIGFDTADGSSVVRVTLRFNLLNLFPTLELPLVGSIPPLPAQLQAQASARI